MAFDEIESKRIEKIVGGLCGRRSPVQQRDILSLEYRIKGHDVILFERRPRYSARTGAPDAEVAKLKFVRAAGEWRLLWRRADLKWHEYDPLPSSRDLARLVEEVDEDPYGCFFG